MREWQRGWCELWLRLNQQRANGLQQHKAKRVCVLLCLVAVYYLVRRTTTLTSTSLHYMPIISAHSHLNSALSHFNSALLPPLPLSL